MSQSNFPPLTVNQDYSSDLASKKNFTWQWDLNPSNSLSLSEVWSIDGNKEPIVIRVFEDIKHDYWSSGINSYEMKKFICKFIISNLDSDYVNSIFNNLTDIWAQKRLSDNFSNNKIPTKSVYAVKKIPVKSPVFTYDGD